MTIDARTMWRCALWGAVLAGCADDAAGTPEDGTTSSGGASSTGSSGATSVPADASSSDGTEGDTGSGGSEESSSSTTEGATTEPPPAPICDEPPDDGNCVAPAYDCYCRGCFDDGVCGDDEDCVCDDCDAAPRCDGICDGDGLCDVAAEGCGCDDCTPLPQCEDYGSPCGDGICDVEAGEDPCSCSADCENDPDACEPCECGGSGGTCSCDSACVALGDCCDNACEGAICGAEIPFCATDACMDGVCDAAAGEDSCNCAVDCPDDPSTCSDCECGGSGGACECDEACVERGDCCDNACELTACGAFAQCFAELEVVEALGLGLEIPDDGYDGTVGSMVCAELEVDDDGTDLVAYLEVELRVDHTYVGDLTVKLISGAGTEVTLMARPGSDAPDDGTNLPFGRAGDLLVSFPVTFSESAPSSAELMGMDMFGFEVVHICADDGLCEFAPGVAAPPAGALTAVVGEDATGTWRVCVGDSAGGDVGVLNAVHLRVGQAA